MPSHCSYTYVYPLIYGHMQPDHSNFTCSTSVQKSKMTKMSLNSRSHRWMIRQCNYSSSILLASHPIHPPPLDWLLPCPQKINLSARIKLHAHRLYIFLREHYFEFVNEREFKSSCSNDILILYQFTLGGFRRSHNYMK